MQFIPLLVTVFSILAFMEPCNNSNQSSTPPDQLFNHWMHSHEEDGDDYKMYRPNSYDFPPSRGRQGFEIKEDNAFVLHKIAPADGTEKINGTWEWKQADSLLQVTFKEEADQKNMKIKVLEVDQEQLKIQL